MKKTFFPFAIIVLALFASCSPSKDSILLAEKNTRAKELTFWITEASPQRIVVLIGGLFIAEQRLELDSKPNAAMSAYVDGVEKAMSDLRPSDFDITRQNSTTPNFDFTLSGNAKGELDLTPRGTMSGSYAIHFNMSINGGEMQPFGLLLESGDYN
jgi:hypothetical protein